jgi:hypothetical protein
MATITGATVVWGVPSNLQTGSGYVTTGVTVTNDGDEKEIRDSSGEVKTWVNFNNFETAKIDVYPDSTASTLPLKGSTVTLGTTPYKCTSAEKVTANDSEVKMTFGLKRWPGNITIS